MIPLYDHNPRHRLPLLTLVFIAICVLVFMHQASLGGLGNHAFLLAYAFIPARLFTGAEVDMADVLAAPASPSFTLLSSMFMHGSWMHLGGNMLYLWTFGDNVENRLGLVRFGIFYVLCGLAAALTQGLIDPTSQIPMVGASGAISGVLGAYLVLFPKAPVAVLIPQMGVQNMSAATVLGMWFVYQAMASFGSLGQTGGGVAFFAHVGGFVAGWALIRFFAPKPQRTGLWE
ncbi:MAG: rhomboid family intramembrane serine protease [Alphaproteobacteria bacterium]